MSKKKNSNAVISELIADNKWEQVHRERDSLKVERIKKLGVRSKLDVLIGGLLVFAAYNSLLDLIKIMQENAEGTEPNEFIRIALLAAAGLLFFFFAMSKNETIDRMTAARYRWIPDRAETDYIEKRFDNDFIRSILSGISSEDTHSVEAGLEAVTINNNTGSEVFNFNKYGFNRMTNYDTKQLAFYLASHSFPEGFVIYQTKITPAGSEKFIGGTTDSGRDQPQKEDADRRDMKMFARVIEQLQEFVKIKNPFEMYLREQGPGAADNGQIVINKGFRADKEEYADL